MPEIKKNNESSILEFIQAVNNYELSPVEALGYPHQLSYYKRECSIEIKSLVIALLVRLVTMSHTKERMNGEQIEVMASDILKDYWFLKPTEVYLILEGGRKHKNFNRLDCSVIHQFFTEYIEFEREKSVTLLKASENLKNEEQIKLEENAIKEHYEVLKQQALEQNPDKRPISERIEKLKKKLRWEEPEFLEWRKGVVIQSQIEKEKIYKQQAEEAKKKRIEQMRKEFKEACINSPNILDEIEFPSNHSEKPNK